MNEGRVWGPHVGEYPAVIPRERSIQEIFPYLQHGVAIYLHQITSFLLSTILTELAQGSGQGNKKVAMVCLPGFPLLKITIRTTA